MTTEDLSHTIHGISNKSNAVGQMSLNVDPNYSQAQMQQISDKLDKLIKIRDP